MTRLNFVCIDNSSYSENAFQWYTKNYHQPEDVVGLMHVHEVPARLSSSITLLGGPQFVEEHCRELRRSVQESKDVIEKYKEWCKDLNIKCLVIFVDTRHTAGNTICETAKEKNANAIIMGQRGLGMISRQLLGSTSDYVLHHSHTVVMVIPSKDC